MTRIRASVAAYGSTIDPHAETAIRLLEPADRHDAALVGRLTELINDVYRTA
jgi:hypothetical protein